VIYSQAVKPDRGWKVRQKPEEEEEEEENDETEKS